MKKYLWLLLLLPIRTQAQTAVALSPVSKQQFFSQAGAPLATGCVNTYITGTSAPLATYVDGTGTAQNPNPIILDGGGFANIWLSNATYRFVVVAYDGIPGNKCAAGVTQYTIDNISAWSILNNAANITLLGGVFDPGGSAGELAYRSDIPCLRIFTSFWDCALTTLSVNTGAGKISNKEFQTPILDNPGIVGTVSGTYTLGGTVTVITPAINGASTGTGVQGTDTKLLTSGTVAGTGVFLCTDANGGATTAGCGANGAATGCTAIGPVTVTNTISTTTLLSCSIGANTLVAGSMLEVDINGINSTGSGYTLILNTNLGGGTACQLNSGVTSIANNQPWNAVIKFNVLTAGAGGTANMSCEYFSSSAGGGVAGPNGVVGAPTISVNTTIANTLLVQETMNVANASNSITAQLLKAVIF